jgi:hypothetical protein
MGIAKRWYLIAAEVKRAVTETSIDPGIGQLMPRLLDPSGTPQRAAAGIFRYGESN